ncbi:hypothetical protein HaloA020_28940 [Halomonas sp. A020]|uniref:hypothetical protein n=1 Tax=Halomonas sp. A020 TaxID=2717374 RepID=UPI002490B0E1|nr:hypothetical protein [Halomonas sp. A020]BCB62193.1 hypothetical protein HaloA020_28940 [Halomonas sp. A020]
MLVEWTVFRCCMWVINVHASNFRGSWQGIRLVLSVASMAGFVFAFAFLGRLALNSEWVDLASSIAIAIGALPIMSFIFSKLGESALLVSPLAVVLAAYLAFSLW